jgi:hypothetical protein
MDGTCGILVARKDVNDVSGETEITVNMQPQFSWEAEERT